MYKSNLEEASPLPPVTLSGKRVPVSVYLKDVSRNSAFQKLYKASNKFTLKRKFFVTFVFQFQFDLSFGGQFEN